MANGSSSSPQTDKIASIAVARERLAQNHSSSSRRRTKRPRPTTVEVENARLIQCLAKQAYHLPGNNSWGQDWRQYLCNNHLLFGICCHHPLHPLKWKIRILALAGSLLVGAFLVNMAYLVWTEYPDWGNQTILSITIGETENVVTSGMIFLWTIGGTVHTAWDLLLWKLAACACCLPGGCMYSWNCNNMWGQHMMRALIFILLVLTALVVLLRVTISSLEEENEDEDEVANNQEGVLSDLGDIAQGDRPENIQVQHDRQEFHFLIVWLMEALLAMLVYYPMAATVLFSGALGCIPGLGGWPAEIAALEHQKESSNPGKSSLNHLETTEDDE
jgi:uncharacterized membrane protein